MVDYNICMIRNKVNGRAYIGKTTREVRTWYRNIANNALRKANQPMHEDIHEYGEGNLEVLVLFPNIPEEKVSKIVEEQREKRNTVMPAGYNTLLKDTGRTVAGRKLTKEHREKVSRAKTGVRRSERFRKKISDLHKGKPKTREHREKLRKASVGRPRTIPVRNVTLGVEYTSITAACRASGSYPQDIKKSCNTDFKAAGYEWEYIEQ